MSDYTLEELLWEQERRRKGFAALESALEQCNWMLEFPSDDRDIVLRIHHKTLRKAIACLRDIQTSTL